MFRIPGYLSLAGQLYELGKIKTAYVADGYIVKLFQAGLSPNEATLAAGFAAMECGFIGYAPISIGGAGFLFVGPVIDASGYPVLVTPSMVWIAADDVAAQQVGGFWVEDTAGVVLQFGIFPSPVPMVSALQFLELTVFKAVNGQGYSEVNN